jgi:L-malate glycosyltransferase
MKAIHQFVSGFANGDAISNEALAWQRLFRARGFASEIFSELHRVLPEHRRTIRDFSTYTAAPEALALLHFSIGSAVNEAFAELPGRKALIYHNITPAHYFERVNPQTARTLEQGRRQLERLAGCAAVNMAVSQFNADELSRAGFPNVSVVPLSVDFDRLATRPDRTVRRRFGNGLTNILCVGRCVPNKKIEDALDFFDLFRRCVEPRSRLIHVGSFAGAERYYYLLTGMVRERGMENVHFAGAVPQSQLNAFYGCADLFLCMSEHEGFCIPILESFHFDVPVLAFAAGAVAETMGGGGVLFRKKDLPLVAEMGGRLTRDRALRRAVVDGQRARLRRYRECNPEEILMRHLSPLLGLDSGRR